MTKPPTEQRYRIFFRGELLEGKDQGKVKRNLAALFKIPPTQADRFFAGKPITIKINADEQTARKYHRAFKRAGAVCRIVREAAPVSPTSRQKPSSPRHATVVTLEKIPGSILYQPFPLIRISGTRTTLTITKNTGQQAVSFAEVIAVTTFFDKEDGPKLKGVFYIKDEPRPLIIDAGNIHYQNFPNVTGENTLASLRNFLTYLRTKNPALIVDTDTDKFLHWSMPPALDKGLFLSHVTALAKHLEQWGFIPKKEKPTIIPTAPAVPVEEPEATEKETPPALDSEDPFDKDSGEMEPEDEQKQPPPRFSMRYILNRCAISARRIVRLPFLKKKEAETSQETPERNEDGDPSDNR